MKRRNCSIFALSVLLLSLSFLSDRPEKFRDTSLSIEDRVNDLLLKMTIEEKGGGDRTSLSLPKIQLDLLKALKSTGKPVIFIMMTGSALGIEWEAANIPSIINAWYGGQQAGTAIADVLFGDYNPSGRLPVTFYKSVNDLPDFEDYSMENRTYRYFTGEPLFAFGHGLSFTTFKYENLVTPDQFSTEGDEIIKVNVKNTGKRDGDEVVQLYISHRNPGTKAPIRALKAFRRINLKAGESKTIEFIISPNELSLTDENGGRVVIPGEVELSVGGCQPSAGSVKSGTSIRKLIPVAGEKKVLINNDHLKSNL